MLELYGNIWEIAENSEFDAVVITTNGYVKKYTNEAVMGRGIALEAQNRWPIFPRLLGNHLKNLGNSVGIFGSIKGQLYYLHGDYDSLRPDFYVFTLPVKPEFGPKGEMGWKAKADIDLIVRSIKTLRHILRDLNFVFRADIKSILMPRPGCGNGGLKWENVKPVIEPLLSDRFTVVTFDSVAL